MIGEGKVTGEDREDTMRCITIKCSVNTNVVVLCEYLPQEFPLWGTIKGYCIVLYCIVPEFPVFSVNEKHK